MKIEALATAPASGSVVEHWFEEPDGDAWFKFETDDGVEWAGLFRDARLVPEKNAVEFWDGRAVLINAGGAGYVIDISNASLLDKPDVTPLVAAMAVPERDFVVARDFTNVYVLGREGELWSSQRIASDGVEFRRTTSNALHGRAFRHGEWHNFTLAYEGWVFTLGDRLGSR
jgi:hypothetical protein